MDLAEVEKARSEGLEFGQQRGRQRGRDRAQLRLVAHGVEGDGKRGDLRVGRDDGEDGGRCRRRLRDQLKKGTLERGAECSVGFLRQRRARESNYREEELGGIHGRLLRSRNFKVLRLYCGSKY